MAVVVMTAVELAVLSGMLGGLVHARRRQPDR